MTITKRAILDLEAEINDILEEDCAEVKFTFHAAYERLNDPRNNPAISLNELEDVFKEFIKIHLTTLLSTRKEQLSQLNAIRQNCIFLARLFMTLDMGKNG
jgi:hypothetical protein